MLKLTNAERAAIIRAACAEAVKCESPVFVIRDALSQALYGTGLDWNEVAELTLPKQPALESVHFYLLENLAVWIEQHESTCLAELLPPVKCSALIMLS